jgi:hypothetical protein
MKQPAHYARATLPIPVPIHVRQDIAVSRCQPGVNPAAAAASAGLVAHYPLPLLPAGYLLTGRAGREV